MSDRQEYIRFKVMPNGNIRAYQSDTYDKRGVSELQITSPRNEAPTLTTENTVKIYLKIETNMKQRDFHRHCRVVYRACRKLYGIEKVQDECLRVFKVFYPVYYRAKQGEDVQFSEKDIERTKRIFESWNPVTFSILDILTAKVIDEMKKEKSREELMQFCDDCLVVVMRIRKLTNRECYRLQGVSEKDIDTLLSCGISKSAHYKLAGNSITSGGNYRDSQGNWDGPLFNLFRKMFVETGPDVVKGTPTQLSLF